MRLRIPALDGEQIANWILTAVREGEAGLARPRANLLVQTQAPLTFDFKKVRRALERARSKHAVKIMQPFRRLRRNQAAVNEGLLDAVRSLLGVNKQMAREIEELHLEVAQLRAQLTERREEKTD